VYFGGALIDFVAARDEEFTEVFATEADIMGNRWRGDDEVHSTGLVTYLDSKSGSHIKPTVSVNTKTAGLRVACWRRLKLEE
jgi:hypothetical protein